MHSVEVTGPLVVGEVLDYASEPQKNGKTIRWCQVDVGDGQRHRRAPGHRLRCPQLLRRRQGRGHPPRRRAARRRSRSRARKTYGHVSDGMICSARELGLGDDHDGILVLPTLGTTRTPRASSAPTRSPLLGLDDEAVEINVTPDRGYCFSVRGVAREYSHATGAPFRDPALRSPTRHRRPATAASPSSSRDDGADPRPRRLRPVRRARRARRRRRASDARAGCSAGSRRPACARSRCRRHHELRDARRSASRCTGTTSTTLGGRSSCAGPRRREAHDARRRRPRARPRGPAHHRRRRRRAIGLAGVMGGAETEVGGDDPRRAHRGRALRPGLHRALGPPAQAAQRGVASRFERGVDPALAAAAAQLAVDLLVEHGGGTADAGVTDVGTRPPPAPVTMHVDFPSEIVGVDYLESEVVAILRGDRLHGRPGDGRPAHGRPRRPGAPTSPTAEDLVEEVARHRRLRPHPVGPAGRRPAVAGLTHAPAGAPRRRRRARRAGLVEVLTPRSSAPTRYDALGLDADDRGGARLRLANPLSDEQPLMRTRLLATHGRRAAPQRRPRHTRRRLFEIGLVAALDGPAGARARRRSAASGRPTRPRRASAPPCRRSRATSACCSPATGSGPAGGAPAAPADVADAVELAARRRRGRSASRSRSSADAVAPWHPGRCARRDARRRHARRPRRRAAPQGRGGARAAGPHRGRRARPRRARRRVRARPCRPAAVHLPDGPERRRARRRRGRAGGRREARPARRRRRAARVACALFDVYRGDQVGEGQQVAGLPR